MSLDLIVGPMFSGKTTELIRRLTKFASIGKKCLYVNSALDTRENKKFSSHNPTIGNIDKIDSIKVRYLNISFINTVCNNYDIIGIDESQLFDDTLTHCIINLVDECNKHVIMSGLNGDFLRNKFGSIIDLIPYCDNIVKLSAYCSECAKKGIIKEAHFSRRTNTTKTDVIDISYKGYIPTCRICYNKK